MSLDKVNERRTLFLPVSFYDEDGLPSTPTTLTCRIDDEESHANLRPEAALTGLAPTMTIVIDEDENVIVNHRREYEIHILTLEWDYVGVLGPVHGTDQKKFKVFNLLGVDLA